MGRLQNEDHKTLAELVAAGGTSSQLLNDTKIYVTANSINDTLSNAIINGSLGGGGGSKNYIVTGTNFENNATTGWSLARTTLDSTSKLPNQVSGSWTAAAGTLSISTIGSGSQLAGNYSLSLASSAATTAGDMLVSNAITLDQEAQGTTLSINFFYKVASGATNGNFSGTSSNSVACAIYDVTNSAWIDPSGRYNFVQSSGVGKFSGTFQVPSNSTSIRLAVYFPNASSGAITLYFDDFSVGPQLTSVGPAMSDWVTYTPTITGTTSNPSKGTIVRDQAFWRRVGDQMEIIYTYNQNTAGTGGSGAYLFSLPSGFSIDTNKVNLPATLPTASVLSYGGSFLGEGWAANTSSGNANFAGKLSFFPYNATTISANSDTNAVLQQYPFGSSSGYNFGSTNFTFQFRVWVPIAGWSSNTVQSSSTDTRVVAAAMAWTTGTLNPNASEVKIPLNSALLDTHSAFNSGTNTYVIPVSGVYQFLADVSLSNVNVLNNRYILFIRKNGTELTRDNVTPAASTYTSLNASCVASCSAGDAITIGLYGAGNNSASGLLTDSTSAVQLSVNRLSGPAIIQATDTIAARYINTAGTSITSSAAAIPFATKTFDSTNSFSGSTFTVPVSGTYLVASEIALTNTTLTTSQVLFLYLYKNGAAFCDLNTTAGVGTSLSYHVAGSSLVQCVAGDTLQIYAACSASSTLNTSNQMNYVNIIRVGN